MKGFRNRAIPTRSKNYEFAAAECRESTGSAIIELIARQLDRADDAARRIKEEGSVVRDMRGAVLTHPAIGIELHASKLAAELLDKHKRTVRRGRGAAE